MEHCHDLKRAFLVNVIVNASGRQEHFVLLVDEVRLKRPDLFNSSGSVQFDGARLTPLATPPCHRLRNYEKDVATSEMKGMAVDLTSHVESTSNPPWFRRSWQEIANCEGDAGTRSGGDERDLPSQRHQNVRGSQVRPNKAVASRYRSV